MGRSLRTDIPQLLATLASEWEYLIEFRKRDKEKDKQKANYDRRVRFSTYMQYREPICLGNCYFYLLLGS